MPYKTSRARHSLKVAYFEIDGRLRLADRPPVDPLIREYVIAASIFLAHAELENFIADIFSAFAVGIQARITKGSALPEALQSHLFLSKANANVIFGKFRAGSSEKDLLKSFAKALKGPAGSIVNDANALVAFTGEDIYSKLKYPSQDNLEKLFYRIGIDNVFDRLSAQLKQDSSALLHSLGSLRTQLAHNGTLPGISGGDVRIRIQDTGRFAAAIDRLMYKTVSSTLGSSVWVSHIC